jgi:DNA-binding NarL/FixJ family response regulator
MYAMRVLRAGGRGYIMKQERPKEVLTAIRQVLSGHLYLSEKISSRLLDQFLTAALTETAPSVGLTDRELEVLTLLGRGYGSREIAEKLFLSIKTVEAHRERIKKKLMLKNSAELIRYAMQFATDRALPSSSQSSKF